MLPRRMTCAKHDLERSRQDCKSGVAFGVSRNRCGDCALIMMLTTLSVPDLTLLFLAVVVALTTGLVWIFWEMEQPRQSQRKSGRSR